MSKKLETESNLRMLTYLMDELSEPMLKGGKLTDKGWVSTCSTNAVSAIKIENERRKLIEELQGYSSKQWKHFLNQFHIWRFHFQLWDCLNDKPCFNYSYQGKDYWTPIEDPRAQEAIKNDPLLNKHVDEDGGLHA